MCGVVEQYINIASRRNVLSKEFECLPGQEESRMALWAAGSFHSIVVEIFPESHRMSVSDFSISDKQTDLPAFLVPLTWVPLS